MRTVRQWQRLSREIVQSLYLRVSKLQLDQPGLTQ